MKAGFVGFGEVNTPTEIIVRKCAAAAEALKQEGVSLVSVYPVTDDYAEKDIGKALSVLQSETFDFLVLCVAGWIPTHAVIKIAERFRHKPMVLWGLCGWMEDGRLVTTADQVERPHSGRRWRSSATHSGTFMTSWGCRRVRGQSQRSEEPLPQPAGCARRVSAWPVTGT